MPLRELPTTTPKLTRAPERDITHRSNRKDTVYEMSR